MKMPSFAFLVFVGGAIFLVLFVGEWQLKLGEDGVSKIALSPSLRLIRI